MFDELGSKLNPLRLNQTTLVTREDMSYQERISIDPAIRSGKPCITGTRITVYDILEYLTGGMTEEEILQDFLILVSDDIKAVLEFAAARERMLAVSGVE